MATIPGNRVQVSNPLAAWHLDTLAVTHVLSCTPINGNDTCTSAAHAVIPGANCRWLCKCPGFHLPGTSSMILSGFLALSSSCLTCSTAVTARHSGSGSGPSGTTLYQQRNHGKLQADQLGSTHTTEKCPACKCEMQQEPASSTSKCLL